MNLSFHPVAGSDYIAAVRCDYADHSCRSLILEKKLDGSVEKVENVTRRKNNIWAINDRNYCLND